MLINHFNPHVVDWNQFSSETMNGETGFAIIKLQSMGAIKIRQVEYSQNYLANHWCDKDN